MGGILSLIIVFFNNNNYYFCVDSILLFWRIKILFALSCVKPRVAQSQGCLKGLATF